MKKIFISILILYSSNVFAGWEGIDGWSFYNLFKQTNISAEEFYPFLREDFKTFYSNSNYKNNEEKSYPKENIALWKKILVSWDVHEIERAIYEPENFSWSSKNTKIDKRAKIYIEFAQICSKVFDYRNQINSWDYNKIKQKKTINTEALLLKANKLLNSESNGQLKARYFYQIIRILHYSKNWEDAIKFYESKIKDKLPKNEIYYYIKDQVAGCYYSVKKYDKAAYLFIEVFNNSIDRKKSAFLSYNLCTYKNADGRLFFNGVEDEKNFLLIKSLRNFSDEVNNIKKFIRLEPNDERIELLFMRALNNVERIVWPKNIGVSNKTLPFYGTKNNYKDLLQISEQQVANPELKNKDFWRMASSYLSFINKDISLAKSKLNKVSSFPNQKKVLSIVYEIFSWNTISLENEKFIVKVLNNYPKETNQQQTSEFDSRNFILDIVAHTYYKNNKIAKAFLVHNVLETVKNISSIELLEALEKLYYKSNKSSFENMLISKTAENINFIDYINYQKGIYYLYEQKPKIALIHFNKNNSYKEQNRIPNTIFSNNIVECFTCDVNEVMDDEVFKAEVFSFIEEDFSRKDLAINLIELTKLTSNEKQWKAKLANYLLANYYYNISNTGYYRGLLTDNTNTGNGIYINNVNDKYFRPKITGEEIITNKSGYNISNISNGNHRYEKHYFNLSAIAMEYYQNTINLSNDKELNARCAYLMAKCELNDYYNNGGKETFKVAINKYSELDIPVLEGYELLKREYIDTKFHKMIIKECSYYKHYSNNH